MFQYCMQYCAKYERLYYVCVQYVQYVSNSEYYKSIITNTMIALNFAIRTRRACDSQIQVLGWVSTPLAPIMMIWTSCYASLVWAIKGPPKTTFCMLHSVPSQVTSPWQDHLCNYVHCYQCQCKPELSSRDKTTLSSQSRQTYHSRMTTLVT